ncbi:MAG: cellulase family glycosylhydrolase [Chloroflexi bacterium]|nr:cellulase family glycosylhydrolase [Chloroflexota bacterium]
MIVVKRFFSIAIGAALTLVLVVFLARDSINQTLADWTGEEEIEYQLKALGYLAVSLTQPAPDTAPFAPMKYADVNPFGINTFLEQEVEETKLRQSLQMIRDAGFKWIRQEFPWEDIEKPLKGQFYDVLYKKVTWEKYDRIVDLAHEYGIEVIARLDHPPAWTRKDGRARGDFAPPDNYDDYGDFVAAVVARYRGKIRFYQLWNEPNIYPEWGEQEVNARDFTRLLKIGYTRVKTTDPSAVVICAGLAQTVDESGRNMSELVFLQEMYDAGARGYFDILAVQDYGLWSGPGDRRIGYDQINFSRPIMVREIMVKNGDANTPIWVMETGWNAQPADFKDAPFGRVSEARQALYAPKGYERAKNEWPWMGTLMYWFWKRADEREKSQSFYYFRMVDPDFTTRPVYNSMREYIPTARYVPMGFRSTSHWAMDWRGDWETVRDERAYFGEYRIGKQGNEGNKGTGKQDDEISFVFRGTDLDLVVTQNPYSGAVRVQVDDAPAREIELWRTDPGVGGRIALARDLDDGAHRVTITVTRAPVAINGFVIQRGWAWAIKRVAMIALLCGAIVGMFAFLRGRR